jgi:phenylpyruvate tautomerase PptA (4-oxalocrotonate tautomerase family)
MTTVIANLGALLCRLPAPAISTASTRSARAVRVQIVPPPGSLNRDGQRQITSEATEIIAKTAGDPSLVGRTWVILTEAAEGGCGIAGTAFGIEEFGALAKKAAEAKDTVGS